VASQPQIDATYNYMDRVWRACLGEHADISGAMYDGDFSLTLEQAQARKHDYILDRLRFRPGHRVLDVGCGWGGFLKSIKERAGLGVGLTLSTKQADHCRRAGFAVHLLDWKEADPGRLGAFDGIASMGAFEHFCSDDEYLAGEQDRIYRAFFKLCHRLLPEDGRLFLQTMTFDRYVPDPRDLTLEADPSSDQHVLALVRKFYPGSWLPRGLDQTVATAKPWFRLVEWSSGRDDYIETINQWNRRLARQSLGKWLAMLSVVPYYLRDPDLKYRLESSRRNSNRECFKRRLMNHYRIVFAKSPA
jgi:cyclopropane-fatty-acyl-phospholipid synthase